MILSKIFFFFFFKKNRSYFFSGFSEEFSDFVFYLDEETLQKIFFFIES
ncbi:hypothetical protein HAN_2g238 (nucleomorph) [Hemiselmis andersenii]|uniref:Uncharacterized protein n=1 Tax=Hemiselmis andersenii TaxID=464988 RepID=A9BKQ9_HEMAN|nr:hypothetical protein HAN_2g238 [Hemiselmis andersenii]ABW98064.1 hypothetical protein HAN_2g238 [Hemiselmis andersenii]